MAYQFEVNKSKNGGYNLSCKTQFEYKEKTLETACVVQLKNYKEGDKIPKDIQNELVKEVERGINKYKLEN